MFGQFFAGAFQICVWSLAIRLDGFRSLVIVQVLSKSVVDQHISQGELSTNSKTIFPRDKILKTTHKPMELSVGSALHVGSASQIVGALAEPLVNSLRLGILSIRNSFTEGVHSFFEGLSNRDNLSGFPRICSQETTLRSDVVPNGERLTNCALSFDAEKRETTKIGRHVEVSDISNGFSTISFDHPETRVFIVSSLGELASQSIHDTGNFHQSSPSPVVKSNLSVRHVVCGFFVASC
mmetsp:Transcript_30524/g.47447  ORF Transcript_30524/g.47447 Transcript_30524/m.47447 type:complete len:238 (+) Transcript_30524:172-885(+)